MPKPKYQRKATEAKIEHHGNTILISSVTEKEANYFFDLLSDLVSDESWKCKMRFHYKPDHIIQLALIVKNENIDYYTKLFAIKQFSREQLANYQANGWQLDSAYTCYQILSTILEDNYLLNPDENNEPAQSVGMSAIIEKLDAFVKIPEPAELDTETAKLIQKIIDQQDLDQKEIRLIVKKINFKQLPYYLQQFSLLETQEIKVDKNKSNRLTFGLYIRGTHQYQYSLDNITQAQRTIYEAKYALQNTRAKKTLARACVFLWGITLILPLISLFIKPLRAKNIVDAVKGHDVDKLTISENDYRDLLRATRQPPPDNSKKTVKHRTKYGLRNPYGELRKCRIGNDIYGTRQQIVRIRMKQFAILASKKTLVKTATFKEKYDGFDEKHPYRLKFKDGKTKPCHNLFWKALRKQQLPKSKKESARHYRKYYRV